MTASMRQCPNSRFALHNFDGQLQLCFPNAKTPFVMTTATHYLHGRWWFWRQRRGITKVWKITSSLMTRCHRLRKPVCQ